MHTWQKFAKPIAGFLCIACLLSLGLCMTERDFPIGNAEKRAISTAESFVMARFPDFEKEGKTLVIRAIGAQWEITYRLPIDMIGGAPVVTVSMLTGEITNAYLTQ
jgi:hypothetical protein